MTKSNGRATVSPSLAKKLVLHKHPKQRIANEAVQLTTELLRLFIVEARNRASVEAECETEVDLDDSSASGCVKIKPSAITKIAADLIMDFA